MEPYVQTVKSETSIAITGIIEYSGGRVMVNGKPIERFFEETSRNKDKTVYIGAITVLISEFDASPHIEHGKVDENANTYK